MKMIRANIAYWAPAAVFIALFLGLGFHFPGFLSMDVATGIISDNAFLGVAAIGVTFVLLTGGIDLSVGSIVALTGIVLAWLVGVRHFNPVLAIVLSLAVGTVIGLVQGILIAKFDIAPFLVTLGGLFFARGLALLVSQESIDIENPMIKSLGLFSMKTPGGGSVTVGTITFLALAVIGTLVLRYTTFGRTVYAIGGSKQSAGLMGLKISPTIISVYALSGFCSALGGILYSIYTLSGNAIAATGMELDAIAAAVIGGCLLSGGYGSVFGSLIGVMILGTVQEAITFQGTLSSWWTKIFIGALLLIFVLLQRLALRVKPAAA